MAWPNKNVPEKKDYGFSVKSIDESEGIVEAYASTFGNVDLDLDIIDAGAFTKTLIEKGAKVPILADHNSTRQIGINREGREDAYGLYVKGRWDIKNNQTAKERFSLVKMSHEEGVPANFSIGFRTIRAEPSKDNPHIRIIKEVQLFEYSQVTFPANPKAQSTAAKFFDDDFKGQELAIKTARFIEAMREQGHDNCEIFESFDKASKGLGTPDNLVHLFEQSLKTLKF